MAAEIESAPARRNLHHPRFTLDIQKVEVEGMAR